MTRWIERTPIAFALLLGLTVVACGDGPERPARLDDDESTATPRGDGGVPTTTFTAPGGEVCGNGLDDDANGKVDEGCTCTPGATQKCFAGSARLAGIGACVMGTQTCVGSGSGEVKSTAWGPCTGSGIPTAETCNGADDDCNGKADDVAGGASCGGPGGPDAGPGGPGPGPGAVPCQGNGLIFTSIGDSCIDDGGQSDKDDDLQVFCVNNVARFCLSHEACPWRDGQPNLDTITCSNAGLASTYFASARQACGNWQGHPRICCSASGQVSFSGC